MKRYLASLLIATTTLMAGDGLCGLYAGGSVGLLTNIVSLKQSAPGPTRNPGVNIPIGNSQRADACNMHLWGELYLGYGLTFCDCLYGGLRLGANFTTGELSAETGWDPGAERITLTAFVRQNHVEPTLDIRGGFTPCRDLLLFALGGVAYNRIALNQERSIPQVDFTRSLSTASDLIGWRVGLGIERLFCCRYGLSFSYIHAYYPTRCQTEILPVSSNEQPFLPQILRARLSRRVATVGLSYYF